VLSGLTPHGLRHGDRTWLDDLGVQETLKSERMGHDMPGMAGVYGHIMPEWRRRLRAQLQELWETSLRERAELDDGSAVSMLNGLLAPYRTARIDLAPIVAQNRTPGDGGNSGRDPRRPS
jgi:hypothetical protein